MHTCGECGKTFVDELDYELHRDRCVADLLVCRACGARFPEAKATTDGWHYRCPEGDCDAEGIGDGLRRVENATLVATR